MKQHLKGRVCAQVLALAAACAWGCGDDEQVTDAGANIDAAGVADAAPPDAELADAAPPDAAPPAPTLTLAVTRAGSGTAYPPANVTATVRDTEGMPWSGTVTMTAVSPTDDFTPSISAVTSLGNGAYRATVSAGRSGEVAVTATATVDETPLSASVTLLFLDYVDPSWGIPTAVTELNTLGSEDSLSVSHDGRTLFFSYTPLKGCNAMPAGLGDDPSKTECRVPFAPIGTAERPCSHGIGTDDLVTLGLFGDETAWPWPKFLTSSYAATRRADGSFENPVCISFDDDGTILEVGPGSGSENPVPGGSYHFFFGYPDWLDIDPNRGGSVYAVAEITAGESVTLSDPITEISNPPATVLAQSLTGPMNTVREDSYQIGEFRVFYNPIASRYELWFERQELEDSTHDIVVSPLVGTYPVGDWGAAQPIEGEVNTDTHHEGFPWPAVLPDGAGTSLHLFYNLSPKVEWSEPSRVMDSEWDGVDWGAPTKILEAGGGDSGAVLLVALPSVSSGDFGVEMFFIYVLTYPGDLDFQIGRVQRIP